MKKAVLLLLLLAGVVRAQDIHRIQHIVIIYKENRSFDHYFGRFPGANGATTGELTTGAVIPLYRAVDDNDGRDICHTWECSHRAINHGRMNRFDDPAPVRLAYSQFDQSSIPNYWAYARHFVLADNYFSTLSGPSFPNHLMSIEADNRDGVVDNPVGPSDPGGWGCGANPLERVAVLLPGSAFVAAIFSFRADLHFLRISSMPIFRLIILISLGLLTLRELSSAAQNALATLAPNGKHKIAT